MQPILKRKAAVPEIQSVDQAVAFCAFYSGSVIKTKI